MSDFFKQICDDIERMASLAVKLKRSEGANVKFEMCERVGLTIHDHAEPAYHLGKYVRAEDIERVLAEAVTVYGHVKEGKPNWWGPRENGQFNDTHTALLINVRPIKPKDSAEQVLKEWVQYCEGSAKPGTYDNLLYRARKVLGEK